MAKLKLIIGAILLLAMTVNAQAHHSFNALFDVSNTISITGEVAAFRFIAPHSYIQLVETLGDESQVMWEVETTTPGMLTRKGVTPNTLQSGQTITVTGNPTRDGRKLIRLLTIRMSDGQELQIQ
ncbi:MAG: hypothetical protein COA71_11965 [SAR86 cluster bacterium]|uniref:DUF5666 domain-containing protein n=1 Tax=SAR86 cluster bacterium TaxID=2030880 RepID=A0A2A5C8R9_9GAMM|nr:hypothetical protein [Gammaproteobacteria bacterium AH-315-E17]PCJ40217.1 MAG: hypothetical protein COA71_11965 [SAR86 cluster bacterium]